MNKLQLKDQSGAPKRPPVLYGKDRLIQDITPAKYRLHQRVSIIASTAGNTVEARIINVRYDENAKRWIYTAVSRNGHNFSGAEDDVRPIGPRPVAETLHQAVREQRRVLCDAMVTALAEALDGCDVPNLPIPTPQFPSRGLFVMDGHIYTDILDAGRVIARQDIATLDLASLTTVYVTYYEHATAPL